MIGTLLAAAAFAAAIPAAAAPPEPLPRLQNRVLLAGCRQGQCSWIRILELGRSTGVAQGELRRVSLRRGSSLHPDGRFPRNERRARISWEGDTRTDYAFCSTVRPAYAFQSEDGALIAHYLDLYDLAGYQMSSATLYMRLCHDRNFTPRTLRALGYRPGTRSEQVEGGSAADLTRF
jgi:hypothetical protein